MIFIACNIISNAVYYNKRFIPIFVKRGREFPKFQHLCKQHKKEPKKLIPKKNQTFTDPFCLAGLKAKGFEV